MSRRDRAEACASLRHLLAAIDAGEIDADIDAERRMVRRLQGGPSR